MKDLYKDELQQFNGGLTVKMACDQGVYFVNLDNGNVYSRQANLFIHTGGTKITYGI